MKSILTTIVLLLFIGCSSTPDEINTAMEPYMSEHFPEATYNTVAKNNVYQLVINDKGAAVTKENVDPIMTQTLGQLFTSFYNTSNSEAADSKIMIVYESETLTHKTKEYDFDELGKMFHFQFK